MPPRDPEPANSRRKSETKLDTPEPELTAMLERYCDLRQRGFTQAAIRTNNKWGRRHVQLLLEEAARRNMPGSEERQQQAVAEWLLSKFDAGTELSVIQRMSALSNRQTIKRLQDALDAASGERPTGLIIRDPDGTPRRVSWVNNDGNLKHRPFDGALPPGYRQDLAIEQCHEVFRQLTGATNEPARDRAYAMLLMAEAGLHSFDNEAGRKINTDLQQAGLDEDARRTVILKLHPHPDVRKLLLERCGIRPRWIAGNRARFLTRRMRKYEYSPAFFRNMMEYMNSVHGTYHGPDYRTPEPYEDDRARCIQTMQELGFSEEHINTAMATLGVPPSGHHPPKRRSGKDG